VIHDIDASLRALVQRDVLNGAGVEIAFDAPTSEWAARRSNPAVDLYLYDIREDARWRDMMWARTRGGDGRVKVAQLPPRRFKLSYLVTAWTQRPEDEHRLLGALLLCFVRLEMVPRELLAGSFADLGGPPILLTIALPPPQDRSLSDVWSALGGELKPSLDLAVTVPVGEMTDDVAALVLEAPKVAVGEINGPRPVRLRR
jgi:hypothetical protein